MDRARIFSDIKEILPGVDFVSGQKRPDELWLKVNRLHFKEACLALHGSLSSPVMMMYASDQRQERECFLLTCVFLAARQKQWIVLETDIPSENPSFDSLARDMHSAILFEREIWEMFGIEPKGHPDLRRLRLHNEVWPSGQYPLRKDFQASPQVSLGAYKFQKVEGEGIFEVPVGPVHAGIIGPGHFRFSVAGEPIVQLETRLGFTHKGIEKLFEGKMPDEALALSECVSGDTVFGHSLAFALACEKIFDLHLPCEAQYIRGIYLELERLYNHVNDIGGMATDTGFSFPAALASIIKEHLHELNEKLTGSRYLKKANRIGGVSSMISEGQKKELQKTLLALDRDFQELVKILNGSVSFMDRVDSTGVLKKKTARDLGVIGLAGRASGLSWDLRKIFPGVYQQVPLKVVTEESGDVLARFRVRVREWEVSINVIKEFCGKLEGAAVQAPVCVCAGQGLGYSEGWRGAVLYGLQINAGGRIERCKVVDPSFHNWPGLSYAVLGNIIPDFPLCNKSFDLSYSGNDL